jgi:hypothetical protein
MRNAVFRDIKTQIVPHRRRITSPLQSGVTFQKTIFFTVLYILIFGLYMGDVK